MSRLAFGMAVRKKPSKKQLLTDKGPKNPCPNPFAYVIDRNVWKYSTSFESTRLDSPLRNSLKELFESVKTKSVEDVLHEIMRFLNSKEFRAEAEKNSPAYLDIMKRLDRLIDTKLRDRRENSEKRTD